ncbi:DUF1559 domain-containing protein [Rhodopirellula sp. MGV]|uniref:DUF1559 family PulG-like putative transporter n=1 Tax=Rhodopirellula sp. MGV TaxID=2023130 RepID=UPI000B969B9E|nr:DUF1559 domain-containing protein [Rhodopirellula sp. MGV]OYP37493.1 hypothetical protein CGZ80_05020 [Rhodopirellula sp. MGV]PNY37895.1 DUF1559 domain-containing protein [Rhodopirellula baltica]
MMFLDPQRPRYWLPNDSPRAPVIPTAVDRHRGMRWADAATVFSGFNTIRPPNSTIAVAGDDIRNPTIASVSSHHHGGAHVLRCDGSTDFFANSVEAGDAWGGSVRLGMTGPLSPGSPSPFGYWGAMGTRAANDSDSPPL